MLLTLMAQNSVDSGSQYVGCAGAWDFAVLAERRRRARRVHLGKDVKVGLAKLQIAVRQALA